MCSKTLVNFRSVYFFLLRWNVVLFLSAMHMMCLFCCSRDFGNCRVIVAAGLKRVSDGENQN